MRRHWIFFYSTYQHIYKNITSYHSLPLVVLFFPPSLFWNLLSSPFIWCDHSESPLVTHPLAQARGLCPGLSTCGPIFQLSLLLVHTCLCVSRCQSVRLWSDRGTTSCSASYLLLSWWGRISSSPPLALGYGWFYREWPAHIFIVLFIGS